ncbi:MAG TPA: DUF1570 domain-containing protein [Planctomycetaceae bacterium]|nr:DUF1570 domain-containing protein [Planctomycetaceae bacterium]
MQRNCVPIAAWLFVSVTSAAPAASPALMELELTDRTVQGRLLALDDERAWVLARDGSLEELAIREITRAEQAAPRFEPWRSAEVRDRLRREFGQGFDVVGTEHYLIVAPPARARQYAEVFENIYRAVYVYFRVRGFQVEPPEFPLVAIVFPDHPSFAAYCRQDGFTAFRGLMGYYLRTSNRVALFDPGDEQISAGPDGEPSRERRVASLDNAFAADRASFRLPPAPLAARPSEAATDTGQARSHMETSEIFRTRAASQSPVFRHSPVPTARVATITAGLRDTIIHEATHQVAFNTGLHTRIGENPKWIVEGLATVFEAPGIRDPGGQQTVASRLNRERFVWFMNYAQKRRPKKSLAAFIESDKAFDAAALDGYSQGWALTFFLLETRPGKYARYLRTIAERDPLRPYPPEDRLADFQSHFGQNLDLLEADFLRFMDRLAQN